MIKSLNFSKTKYMSFSSKRKSTEAFIEKETKRAGEFKFLGFTINKHRLIII